jgi:hypothetical protein
MMSTALLAVAIGFVAALYWLPAPWDIVALVVASLTGLASLLFAAVARARRHQESPGQ